MLPRSVRPLALPPPKPPPMPPLAPMLTPPPLVPAPPPSKRLLPLWPPSPPSRPGSEEDTEALRRRTPQRGGGPSSAAAAAAAAAVVGGPGPASASRLGVGSPPCVCGWVGGGRAVRGTLAVGRVACRRRPCGKRASGVSEREALGRFGVPTGALPRPSLSPSRGAAEPESGSTLRNSKQTPPWSAPGHPLPLPWPDLFQSKANSKRTPP